MARTGDLRLRDDPTSPFVVATVPDPAPSAVSHHGHGHRHQTPTRPNRRPAAFQPRLLLLLVCCLFSVCSATIYIDEEMIEAPSIDEVAAANELLGSTIARLARTGTILVDPDMLPSREHRKDTWILNNQPELRRRDDSSSTTLTSVASRTQQASLTPSSSTSTVATGIITASSTGAPSPLPSPLDSGFSSNVTQSCSNFINTFLANGTFKACLPFSLLLQNSNSFFQAEKSLFQITQTLDYTCAANLTSCAPYISALASSITAKDACASDLSARNPLVTETLSGLEAYKPLYEASCLRNPTSSAYCFADAITNTSAPTDSYIYYLPLNVSLPGGSQPTCNACLQQTMAVFEAESATKQSALAFDYSAAAVQINVNCGPNFVNQSVAPVVGSGGTTLQPWSAGAGGGHLALLALSVWAVSLIL